MGYNLDDVIYPWSTSVKKIKIKSSWQEESALCQGSWSLPKIHWTTVWSVANLFAVVWGPHCFWDKRTLGDITTACVVLHNMIIGDERGNEVDCKYDYLIKTISLIGTRPTFRHFLKCTRGSSINVDYMGNSSVVLVHVYSCFIWKFVAFGPYTLSRFEFMDLKCCSVLCVLKCEKFGLYWCQIGLG